MAHLLSIAFFLSLLAGLGMLLDSMFRSRGRAIRAALLGTWAATKSARARAEAIGACLRASFPSRRQEALSDELNNLVLQLSTPSSPER